MSLAEKGNEQIIKQNKMTVPVVISAGITQETAVEGVTDLNYGNKGRLKDAAFKMFEAGKPDSVITSKAFTYDWVNGDCRPSRITVRNRPVLSDKTGVLFDAEVCKFLKEKGSFDRDHAEACVKSAMQTFQKLQEFDQNLRKRTGEREMLVATNAYSGGNVFPIKGLTDTGIAMSFLSSCAAYLKPGNPHAVSPAASGATTPTRPKS